MASTRTARFVRRCPGLTRRLNGRGPGTAAGKSVDHVDPSPALAGRYLRPIAWPSAGVRRARAARKARPGPLTVDPPGDTPEYLCQLD
jgi:hypothetical protein